MSGESSALWHIFCVRRVEREISKLVPPLGIQRDGVCNLRILREVVSRNISRADRRWKSAEIFSVSEEQGPLTLEDGAALQSPSDYGMAPDLPQEAISLRPPLGLVDLSAESARELGGDQLAISARPPKHPSGDLGALSPQRVHTDSQEARSAGQQPVIWVRADAFSVNGEDFQPA